jgi:hypothetical protein
VIVQGNTVKIAAIHQRHFLHNSAGPAGGAESSASDHS